MKPTISSSSTATRLSPLSRYALKWFLLLAPRLSFQSCGRSSHRFSSVAHLQRADLHAHISSGAPMPRQSSTSAMTSLAHSTRVSLASLRGPESRTDTEA